MYAFRFSLAHLIGVVVVLAFALAAIRGANDFWAAGAFSLTLLVLFTAILGAALARGPTRAFWLGFTVFGWGYFTLALGPWFADRVSPHLVTTKSLNALQNILPQYQIGVGDKGLVQWGSGWYRCSVLAVQNGQYLIHYEGYSSASDEVVPPTRIKLGEPEHYLRIGHSIFGILFGLLGSAMALWMASSRRPPPTDVPNDTALSLTTNSSPLSPRCEGEGLGVRGESLTTSQQHMGTAR